MKKYQSIINHYEACYEQHGDSHLGVDWPNKRDTITRFSVMLDVILDKTNKTSLLDFGCGTGHLLEYIEEQKYQNLLYTGLDISSKFVDRCKEKFPHNDFLCLDIFDAKTALPSFDYVIMNGVFTEKREMLFDDMWSYFKSMIKKVYSKTNYGLSFNVMSSNVDWEREDLFHLPLDKLTAFLCKEISRNFIIRNDYGLYEYTTYIYK